MAIKHFKQAISSADVRLKEPHIAVLVIETEMGPVVPLIKRRKYLKDEGGNSIPDENGKPSYEEFCDLPGGKLNPIEIDGFIREIESEKDGTARECWEETGLFIDVGDEIARADHPVKEKKDLKRVFHEAQLRGGIFHNKVPEEHDYAFLTDPESAIQLLGERVPQEVRDNIRQQADAIYMRMMEADAPDLRIGLS